MRSTTDGTAQTAQTWHSRSSTAVVYPLLARSLKAKAENRFKNSNEFLEVNQVNILRHKTPKNTGKLILNF